MDVYTTPVRDFIDPQKQRRARLIFRLQLISYGLLCFAVGFLTGGFYGWDNQTNSITKQRT